MIAKSVMTMGVVSIVSGGTERDALRVTVEEVVSPDRVGYRVGLLPERLRAT